MENGTNLVITPDSEVSREHLHLHPKEHLLLREVRSCYRLAVVYTMYILLSLFRPDITPITLALIIYYAE